VAVLISEVVQGEPLGKQRPIHSPGRRRPRTPDRTVSWETSASAQFRAAWGRDGEPYLGAVILQVAAVKSRPKKYDPGKYGADRIWRLDVPDGDNVLKIVADSLKKAEVFRDDRQIVAWYCLDLYAAVEEGPCVEVLLAQAPARPRGAHLVIPSRVGG